ncbi:chemotaxis protein CheW [Limnoglobus roseus]|uniref:Chemotaxis protein CheW n=1 Tax=Limnoglobus roseus TaxID=2598579 RepID=A0A5C1A6B6_9BACT|nr:chemotaxis protein CheW [Limnoglobus roseus]QEL13536.1 CheW purine-binding chemotaxis protein [Limnoglobus roseus]
MTALPVTPTDCWNRIGVRGDRSCPELVQHVHCQNCPVFGAAGRRFLDAPAPVGYQDEWAARLAAPVEDEGGDRESVLVFRVGGEWLALSVHVLVEVSNPKPVHRVPHRTGILAGLVNVRGELHLCVHLAKVLGITAPAESPTTPATGRLLLVRRDADRWVFPVDAVDQVHRLPRGELRRSPATVSRAAADLSRGVFHHRNLAVGVLDERRLFEVLRTKLR